jgi:hypothetical protein
VLSPLLACNDEGSVIDVSSHIEITRAREDIGAYTFNLDNAREWFGNLRSLEWLTPPPLAVRSRIRVATELFGHSLKATYEIVSLSPAEHLAMRADRPFPIEMRYLLESITAASTRVTIRGRVDPGGFLSFLGPMIADGLRELYRDDLVRLKKLLENERPSRAAF